MKGKNNLGRLLQDEVAQAEGFFIHEEYSFIYDSKKIMDEQWRVFHEPHRTFDIRIMLVVKGNANFNINLKNITLKPQDLLLLPVGCLVEHIHSSHDFSARIMSLSDNFDYHKNPAYNSLKGSFIVLSLKSDDYIRFEKYEELILMQCPLIPPCAQTVLHTATAMINDILRTHNAYQNTSCEENISSKDEIFQKFLVLVNIHGVTEHSVEFYAKSLFVSPNYLSNLIKQESGQTVKDWIDRYLISEAKFRLKNSGCKIYLVASQLNFSSATLFTKFFKRYTGMTPAEYQKLSL